MLLLIDNYDSFTYNLVHLMGEAMQSAQVRGNDAQIKVLRNDKISAEEAIALEPSAIVISPGPGTPDQAGICLDLIGLVEEAQIPLLGVCLGHQAIGQRFGGSVVRAEQIMHGKTSQIHHNGAGVFKDTPATLSVTRYHSLTVAPESLPGSLEITAQTDDGLIMGLSHRSAPIHGVQFHPESVASEHGRTMLSNFLTLAEII
ncbi:MAG: aminodeoxychorismate/anthranilate synthase component II [Neomegalonema sp.]|nr:aminodeoxychorismate/anthranilate synthase component II [Neomegalonema sp.]